MVLFVWCTLSTLDCCEVDQLYESIDSVIRYPFVDFSVHCPRVLIVFYVAWLLVGDLFRFEIVGWRCYRQNTILIEWNMLQPWFNLIETIYSYCKIKCAGEKKFWRNMLQPWFNLIEMVETIYSYCKIKCSGEKNCCVR